MNISSTALRTTYGAIAIFTLIPTWGNFIPLIKREGFWGANINFWEYVLANEATRFITADALFFGLAFTVWMVIEARRLGMSGVWAYVAGFLIIGIGVAAPLFLIQRERRLAFLNQASPPDKLTHLDLVLLGILAAAFTVYSLTKLL